MWAAALSTGRMFASTMADEMAAVWCAANVLGEARDWPYCVESCVVGKREVSRVVGVHARFSAGTYFLPRELSHNFTTGIAAEHTHPACKSRAALFERGAHASAPRATQACAYHACLR